MIDVNVISVFLDFLCTLLDLMLSDRLFIYLSGHGEQRMIWDTTEDHTVSTWMVKRSRMPLTVKMTRCRVGMRDTPSTHKDAVGHCHFSLVPIVSLQLIFTGNWTRFIK